MNLWQYMRIGNYFLYPNKEQSSLTYSLSAANPDFMKLVSDKDKFPRRLTNSDFKLIVPEEYM